MVLTPYIVKVYQIINMKPLLVVLNKFIARRLNFLTQYFMGILISKAIINIYIMTVTTPSFIYELELTLEALRHVVTKKNPIVNNNNITITSA